MPRSLLAISVRPSGFTARWTGYCRASRL